jgi:NAD+ synthase (glutamine-hydrolysing)
MRAVLAPINPTIGDLPGNAALIERAVRRAMEGSPGPPDLIALPELAICGYPPKDLLGQEGFVERCVEAADAVGAGLGMGTTLVIGTPTRAPRSAADDRARVANSLLVYQGGQRVARYDKRLLPTYDVFDEDRYFEPGTRAVVVDVPIRRGGSMRVGLAICEDLWRGLDAGFSSRYEHAGDPAAEAVGLGARVIVCPSASPFVLGKSERHEAILRGHASRHGVWIASVNQLGGNDELVFDGHSMVFAPDGRLWSAGESFADAGLACEMTIDPIPPGFNAGVDVVPSSSQEGEALLWSALVLGVRDYARKNGFERALLGLSGGIDSALTGTIATAALGPSGVLGVLMPGTYSSEHASADARELARRLGVRTILAPIESAAQGLRGAINPVLGGLAQPALGASLPDLADENLQSRVRGTILMTLSNRLGAIVLTTGNKSELAVGYCTLYGDMNGGLAVLSDVTKHWVYRLARWCNEHWRELGIEGLAEPPIPESSLTKPPSAELRPNQTDQDSLPPYDTVDEIVRRYVELRESRGTIARGSGIDRGTVDRIVRLIDLSEYKRKQAAIGLKVTSVAFGSGRRWPITQRWRD